MQRVNAAGATVDNKFTNGDPGLGIPATTLEQTWHNDVQEEICAVIEGYGVTLNGAQQNQLKQSLDARFARIPQGTVMVFFQAAAPTGWTQVTAHSDRALRVVSGAGGGVGGTHDLSAPPSTAHVHTGPAHTHDMGNHTHTGPSHTHSTPAHSHGLPIGTDGSGTLLAYALQASGSVGTTKSVGTSGGGGTHNKLITDNDGGSTTGSAGTGSTSTPSTNTTGSAGTGNTGSSGPAAFAPKYVDVILCSRN